VKLEYDVGRDLLYVGSQKPDTAVRTETRGPGYTQTSISHRNLVGVEVIEAGTTLGGPVQIEVALPGAN